MKKKYIYLPLFGEQINSLLCLVKRKSLPLSGGKNTFNTYCSAENTSNNVKTVRKRPPAQ